MKNLHAWVNKQEHVLPVLLSGAISHKQAFKGHIHQLTMCKAPAAVAAFWSEYIREEYATSWTAADQLH